MPSIVHLLICLIIHRRAADKPVFFGLKMKVNVLVALACFASACVEATGAIGAINLSATTSTESSSDRTLLANLHEADIEPQGEDSSIGKEELMVVDENEEHASTPEVSPVDSRTMPKPLLLWMEEEETSPTTLAIKHDSELSNLAERLSGTSNFVQCKDLLEGAWYDSDGPMYNCDWYAIDGDFKCSKWGSYAENFGLTANEACCACGGGDQRCFDTEDWIDDYGDGCQWYSEQESRCDEYGVDSTENGQTANDACCVCGGGTMVDDDGNRCTNTKGWIDEYGDNCLWYSENDGGCEEYGEESTEHGQTANEACCVCGGGEIDTSVVYGNQRSCSNVDSSRYNMCLDLASINGTVQPWMDAFIEARRVWESVIVGNLGEPVNSTLLNDNHYSCTGYPALIDDAYICGSDAEIDGVGNVLGSAATTFARTTNETNPKTGRPYEVSLAGFLRFDVADINYMIDSGSFANVIVHEIGHVLGIGTLWGENGLYADETSDGVYANDSNAQREWEALGCTGNLPVETDGGPGTAGGHWDEQCLRNELMTGYLSGSDQPLSTITVGTLQDMGYAVAYSQADPFTLSDLGTCPNSCPEAGGQRRLRSSWRTSTYSKEPLSAEGRAAILQYAKSEFFTLSKGEPSDLPEGVIYVAPDYAIDVLYASVDGIRAIKVTRQEADDF